MVDALTLKLNLKSSFIINKSDIIDVLSCRTSILLDKQVIDFSTLQLTKWAELILNESSTGIEEWKNKMNQFFEIYYELRDISPSYIEDEKIFELIQMKYHYYEEDLIKVAGFFETNFDLERIMVDDE